MIAGNINIEVHRSILRSPRGHVHLGKTGLEPSLDIGIVRILAQVGKFIGIVIMIVQLLRPIYITDVAVSLVNLDLSKKGKNRYDVRKMKI